MNEEAFMNGRVSHGFREMVLMLLSASIAVMLLYTTAAYANDGDSLAAESIALTPQTNGIKCEWGNVTKGEVTWNALAKTITLNNATIKLGDKDDGIHIDGSSLDTLPTVTLKLVGTNTIVGNNQSLSSGIYAEVKRLIIIGPGTLNIKCAGCFQGICVDGTLDAQSGAVTIYGAKYGIDTLGGVTLAGSRITINNTRTSGIDSGDTVSLKRGTLSVNGAKGDAISSFGDVVVSGASVSMLHCSETGIHANESAVNVKSGKLVISDCKRGVCSDEGFSMTGGSVSVTRAKSSAIVALNGKAEISKGSVTAKCTSTNEYAIRASKGVMNKPSCLKAIVGLLDKGASFAVNNNTYVMAGDGNVILKSYGATSTKPEVNEVKFGNVNYSVTGIGAKAFATKRGRAITAITLGVPIESIGANAFYGTSRLTKLNIEDFYFDQASLNKKAFSKCGKNGGAGLKVYCEYAFDTKDAKKTLTKAGLSPKATFFPQVSAKKILEKATDNWIYYFRYLDDDKTQAVAITATDEHPDNAPSVYEEGQVWFVANGKATELFGSDFIGCYKGATKLYPVKGGHIFVVEESYVMTSSSTAWFIRDNKAIELPNVGGNLTMTGKNEFTASHSTHDPFRSYKRYYYHWNGKKLIEYGGKKMTETQLKHAKNGSKCLKIIAKLGKIGPIYYRSNGIINVNYNNGNAYSNVTLKFKAGKVTYAKVNTFGKRAIDRATDAGKYQKRNPDNVGRVAVSYPKSLPSKLRKH